MLTTESEEAHIWLSKFSDNYKDTKYFEEILSQGEIERASRLASPINRKQWIISRGILRCLLSKYLNIKPASINILYGIYGKPLVSAEYSFYFNLSHSNDCLTIALSSNSDVGIDIEYINPTLDSEAVVSNILSSEEEIKFWRSVAEKDKLRAFFRLWVCKEAFLKMYGQGWSRNNCALPLETISYMKFGRNNEKASNIQVPHIFEPEPEYIAALFTKRVQSLIPIHYTWQGVE